MSDRDATQDGDLRVRCCIRCGAGRWHRDGKCLTCGTEYDDLLRRLARVGAVALAVVGAHEFRSYEDSYARAAEAALRRIAAAAAAAELTLPELEAARRLGEG
jgi:hypothetical protein